MNDLQRIPYIGPQGAADLERAGFMTVESLKGQDPEDIYMRDNLAKGYVDTRVALYVYRLAVAWAESDGCLPDDKRHWWQYKN